MFTVKTFAQDVTLALKAPAAAVTIDGDSKEWGDSLAYYNAENKINYAIANDKNNLYLVVRTNNPTLQNNILSSGITFSIDPKGRKKSAYSVTFPVSGQEGRRRPGNSLEENKMRAQLTQLRKYGVDGFKDISDEQISAGNMYGIKAAIDFDEKGYMVYEETIPLDLFHANADATKADWAFNIKVNGIERGNGMNDGGMQTDAGGMAAGASGGGRGSGGVTRGGTVRHIDKATIDKTNPDGDNTGSKSVDFWGKFNLAKQ